MGGPTHDAEALAAFQSGEERLVYARYKDRPVAPSSYYLVDGTARDRELKAWVKEHLECLMPECPDRRLVAVNRSEHSGRRDGFSHHRGAGQHGLEGLFHQQAKALIQSWVTDRFPHVQAVPEQATADGSRRADVMLTWPDGKRAAVEIQYASLTVEAWLLRHESYLAQGITPIWLLGHHGAHMKRTRDKTCYSQGEAAGQIKGLLLHQKMIEYGAAVMWVNPVDQTVATPWVQARLATGGDPYSVPLRCDFTRAFSSLDQLDDCSLREDVGLISPTAATLSASHTEYNRQVTTQRAKEADAETARHAAREAITARRREAARDRRGDPPSDTRPGTATSGVTNRSVDLGVLRCTACGLRLDPILAESGHHIGC